MLVNRTKAERTYSCVIDGGATDVETTIFTYIVRTLSEVAAPRQRTGISTDRSIEFLDPEESDKHVTPSTHLDEEKKLVPHDAMNIDQIDALHDQQKSNAFPSDQ